MSTLSWITQGLGQKEIETRVVGLLTFLEVWVSPFVVSLVNKFGG